MLLIAPYLIVGAMDARPAKAEDRPQADTAPVIVSTEPTLHPTENELIEAALVEQGHFSDDVPLSYQLQDITRTACEEYGVPYALALAVMERESGFDVEAVGIDGHDIGVFQIRTSNHAWLTEETGADPMTPEGNIKCGVWLLGYLLDRYEDEAAALTAYRWGSDTGDREYAMAAMEAAERWKEVIE